MIPQTRALVLTLTVFGFLSCPAPGQTFPTRPATQPATRPAEVTPEQRLWAYRAARAEAVLGLIQQIRVLPLTDKLRVAALLDDSEVLDAALGGHLLGLPDAEPARHADDGTCEVSLEVSFEQVAAALSEIRRRHYTGERFKAASFEPIAQQSATTRPVRQTGRGEAPSVLLDLPLLPARPGEDALAWADAATKKYWLDHVTDAGRARAQKLAWEDAARGLTRQIENLPVDGKARLAEFFAGEDKADLSEFLRGVRHLGLRLWADAPVVEVQAEIPVQTVYAAVKNWLHRHRPGQLEQIGRVEQLILAATGSLRQVGIGWPEVGQLKELDPRALSAVALASSAPQWVRRPLGKTGRGKTALAAEQDARVALAAAAGALEITEAISVGRHARRDDALRAGLLAWLQSARAAGEPTVKDDGTVEVKLELPPLPLWRLILQRLQRRIGFVGVREPHGAASSPAP